MPIPDRLDKGKGMDKTGKGAMIPKQPAAPPPMALVAAGAADIDHIDEVGTGTGPTRFGQMCKKQQHHTSQIEELQSTIILQTQKLKQHEQLIKEQQGRLDVQAERIDAQEARMNLLLRRLDRVMVRPTDEEPSEH